MSTGNVKVRVMPLIFDIDVCVRGVHIKEM